MCFAVLRLGSTDICLVMGELACFVCKFRSRISACLFALGGERVEVLQLLVNMLSRLHCHVHMNHLTV